MRIHGICLVKNEADILAYSLGEALNWCDAIYVLDNGSTDGTWELVGDLAARFPRIVPFRQEFRPFDNALRGLIFNEFKHQAHLGDWWCRLDADEVYVEDPRAFLNAVPSQYHVVWATHLQFYLTEKDLERFGPEDLERAPAISEANLPRSYLANASEGRFFRHRPRLQWTNGSWPRHLGLVYPERIRVKHYQHRSPAQIQRRLDTRQAAIAAGNVDFPHIVEHNWKETLSTEPLESDSGNGEFVVHEDRLPRHLEPLRNRLVKRLMHGLGIWP